MGKFLGKLDLFGMIVLIAALGLYSYRGVWTVYQTAAAAAGGAMILAAIVAKRREIAAALKRRSTLFSLNSFISVLIILGILSLINFLGYRHNKRFDMTAEKLHSLSDQTLKVLDQIQVPVKAWAFYPGGEYKPAKDLLIEYRARNKKFEFEFVDPDKQPQVAKKYNVRVYGRFNNPFTRISVVYGTVVLESDGRTEKIEKQDEEVREEDITNALLRIIKPESKVIYFLTGHGEKSIDESEAEGYSMVKEGLEQERYQVKSLSLVREQKVPDDCAVLVVAGPATEPFPEELDKINQYLERGGSLFALLDPPPAAGLRDFLLKWSVEVGDDLILDGTDNFPTRFLVNDACVLAKKTLVHGAILRFDGQVTTIAPGDGPCYRCVFPEPPPPGAVPSCSQAGILGAVAGIIGSIMAAEAVKAVLNLPGLLKGRILSMNALDMSFREVNIRRDPNCAVCGDNPAITRPFDMEFSCEIGDGG